MKTCLFLSLRKFYILCANDVVLTLNILSVYAVFYFKHPGCSHSWPTVNILSVNKMWSLIIRLFKVTLLSYLEHSQVFFPKESCLLYMYTLNILIVRGFSTLNILNVPAVFLPWTSWALWGPCHPVGPYRTGEGRCRHWPGSGPYWNLSKGIKAREGHLHTKCKTGMS